jgi:hypothetical protein
MDRHPRAIWHGNDHGTQKHNRVYLWLSEMLLVEEIYPGLPRGAQQIPGSAMRRLFGPGARAYALSGRRRRTRRPVGGQDCPAAGFRRQSAQCLEIRKVVLHGSVVEINSADPRSFRGIAIEPID